MPVWGHTARLPARTARHVLAQPLQGEGLWRAPQGAKHDARNCSLWKTPAKQGRTQYAQLKRSNPGFLRFTTTLLFSPSLSSKRDCLLVQDGPPAMQPPRPAPLATGTGWPGTPDQAAGFSSSLQLCDVSQALLISLSIQGCVQR